MIARFRIFFFSMLYASGNYIVKKKKRKDKKKKERYRYLTINALCFIKYLANS